MARHKRARISCRLRSCEKLLLLDAQRLAHIGTWEWDINDDFVRWSDELYRIHGLDRAEFGGTYAAVLERIHPDDRAALEQLVADALGGKKQFELQHRIIRADGSVGVVRAHGAVVSDKVGRPERLIGTAQDITEYVRIDEQRRKLETQLRHVQKMEALGQLAGGVAHDFNGLLTSIRGYCELLMRRFDGNTPEKRMLGVMFEACNQATNLAQQLVAFTQTKKLQPEVVNLNEIVCDLEELLQRTIGEDIEMVKFLSPELWRVTADTGQIQQVIVNLAVNSRDAMPNGGRLTIETNNAHISQDAAPYQYAAPGEYVKLVVSDNGTGMDESIKARVFEPFFTTKPLGKGTGLGLATVYGIVKQNGGDIRVESALHRGTTFEIFFPRCADSLPGPAACETSVPIEKGTETVLVVEDDPRTREVTCSFLKELGYQVLEAGCGAEALSICSAHRSALHLILTDVIMPRMNGPRLVQRARTIRDDFAVLYVSGHPDGLNGKNNLVGHTSFLQKPFTQRQLARKVREACDVTIARSAPQFHRSTETHLPGSI